MAECCIQHVLRRLAMLLVIIGLIIAAARSAQQAALIPEYKALYVCSIAAEVTWIITILANIVRLDSLPKYWTWLGAASGLLSITLLLVELGIEPLSSFNGDVWLKVRYGIAYVAVGILYGHYAYCRLRSYPHPLHVPVEQHDNGGEQQGQGHNELVEITLGG